MSDIGKLSELLPQCQWAAGQWLAECQAENLQFTVAEVYRTQQRQDQLYAQGRTTPGNIVTWTHSSMHTQRLAADVIAINCTYEQIEAVANRFGIYRPPELVKLGDIGHFAFDRCMLQPQQTITPQARLQGYINRLKVTVIPYLKQELPKLIARMKQRMGL